MMFTPIYSLNRTTLLVPCKILKSMLSLLVFFMKKSKSFWPSFTNYSEFSVFDGLKCDRQIFFTAETQKRKETTQRLGDFAVKQFISA